MLKITVDTPGQWPYKQFTEPAWFGPRLGVQGQEKTMTNHSNRSVSRAKFTLSGNYVTLEYDDTNTGERTKREFYIGWNGGYVRETTHKNFQVCRGLSFEGSTLMASDPDDLLRIIRREYGAMRRAERAEDRRYR